MTSTVASLHVGHLSSDSIDQAVALLESENSVQFLQWERQLLERLTVSDSDLVPVVLSSGGEIVGIAVAGVFGVRGTISHLVTDPGWRGRGVGGLLTQAAVAALRRRGIRRIFTVTTDGNTVAESFWRSEGFVETVGETTFEIDL